MKKIFSLVTILLMLLAVPAFAVTPLQTAQSIAVAAPYFIDSGLAWGNATGGWSVGSAGVIEVTSYAQGTKFAETAAYATGTGFGVGGALGIQTPNFGFGVSGAISGVCLVGEGYGLGIDKLSFFNNPDYASVKITYSGEVVQSNGVLVDNGFGTWAGGGNTTGATFTGGSFDQSYGKLFGIDFVIPALAVGADGAGALAGGYTIAGYVDTPNFAAANASTFGFSSYCGDFGTVYGSGNVQHQAVVDNGGSFGLSYGSASFGYSGCGSFGYGAAQTSGWTKITNGSNSNSVTSYSSSSAYSN